MNHAIQFPGCTQSCDVGPHTVGAPGPRTSAWPVTGSVSMAHLEQMPIRTVRGPAPVPFDVFGANGAPDPLKVQQWIAQQGQQIQQAGQPANAQMALPLPAGPQPAAMPGGIQAPAAPSPFAPASPCPPGPAAGSEQFRFAAYYAQRQVQDLILKLQQPWPQAGTATTHRWEDRKNHGFMGDKPNRTHNIGQGSHPDIATYDRTRLLDVPQGTRVFLWSGRSFQGQRYGPYGPGSHQIPNAESALVTPDLDIAETVRMALGQLKTLSCPANGCVINAQNYETHSAVVAFVQYLDRVIKLYGNTPMARELEMQKTQLLADLARGVLASQSVCGAGAPAQGPTPQPAPGGEQCGVGVTALTVPQMQALQKAGTPFRIGKSLSDGRVCVRVGAHPRVGDAPGGGRPTKLQGPCQFGNFYGECLTSEEAQCVAQGGRMQGRVNRRTQRLENLRCLRPGAGMIMQDVSTLPTRVPGQAYSQQRVAPVRVPLTQLTSAQYSGASQPGISMPGAGQPAGYAQPGLGLPPGFQQFPQ